MNVRYLDDTFNASIRRADMTHTLLSNLYATFLQRTQPYLILLLSLVPSSVQLIRNVPVVEGGNVSLYCNASGSPDPIVTWSGHVSEVVMGPWLNITNISRPEDNTNNHLIYQCHANNTCGDASKVASIDVLCKKISLSNVFIKICYGQ